MVSKRTEELLALDLKYLIHGFAVVGSEDVWPIIERAEGVKCWDTEGNAYYDAASQQTSNTLGHGQKEIIDAICEQAKKLQFAHLLAKQSNVPIIEYAAELAKVIPAGMAHFFFTNDGSEAVETAFKLARLYWHVQGKPKYKIISLQNSYHGAGLGSAAATRAGSGAFWTGYAPLAAGFIQAPTVYCNRCSFNLKYPSCDTEYFPIVRQICNSHDVFMIADEVQTGFGRTGKLWGQEHWPLSWDIMTIAKAINGCYIPFGATLLSDRVFAGLKGTMLWHGFTQHGNPICAAAASAALKIIFRDKMVENAERVGNYVLERLNREFKSLPSVSDISGLGLMLGIELVKDKKANTPFDAETMKKWIRRVLDRGLYVRMALARDYSRVRFNPPIITTEKEADEMLDILYTSIAELK